MPRSTGGGRTNWDMVRRSRSTSAQRFGWSDRTSMYPRPPRYSRADLQRQLEEAARNTAAMQQQGEGQ